MSKRYRNHDPLDLLRRYTMSKREVKLKNEYLYFGENKFRLSTQTVWKSNETGQNYSLGSLWLLLENKVFNNPQYADYIKSTVSLNVQRVVIQDFDEILNYFTGKIDTSLCINEELRQELLNKRREQKQNMQKNKDEDDEKALEKKIKVAESDLKGQQTDEQSKQQTVVEDTTVDQLKVMDWISKIERPIQSRLKLLRSQNFLYKNFIDRIQIEANGPSKMLGQPKNLLDSILRNKRYPLILLSNINENGQLTLRNASSFLKDGLYKDPKLLPNPDLLDRKIYIKKTISGREVTFECKELLQLPKDKKDECDDWKRLVGVFLCGKCYQFRLWPLEADLPKLFSQKRGYYIKFNEMETEPFVKKLNVKILEISRKSRDLDRSIVHSFWQDLIEFVHRPI